MGKKLRKERKGISKDKSTHKRSPLLKGDSVGMSTRMVKWGNGTGEETSWGVGRRSTMEVRWGPRTVPMHQVRTPGTMGAKDQ